MINIVLYQPEIPQNTGNVARTCACTGASLHLIRPLGFEITDKQLKRAGLDYWDKLNIYYYDSLQELQDKYRNNTFYYVETFATKYHTQVNYDKDPFLVFGKETTGIPKQIVMSNIDTAVKIPMKDNIRSLNLSNSVAVVVYEVIRQQGI